MSVIEIYNPKFEDFHGRAMVTWRHGNHPPRIDENFMEQYQRWRSTKLPKDEPSAIFWETKGPAIARALGYCGAKALIIERIGDNRVTYRWFARSPRSSSTDAFVLCSVVAEGGSNGGDTRVHVTLPTDELVVFNFAHAQMQGWLKSEPVPSE